MPPKKSMKKKAPARRRRLLRRRPLKYNAKRVGGPNTCRIVETLPSRDIDLNTPYIVSVGGITGTRATAVAEQFGLYRIAKVIFRFKPNFDTYASSLIGGAAAYGVPTLYWKMNRFADAPAAFTGNDLKTLGAKPYRFDDKQVVVSYKPNILTGIVSAGDNSGQLKITPWLNTDAAPDTANFAPSDTEHYGHLFIVETNLIQGAGDTPIGSFDATIIYEFKNPRTKWNASGVQAVQLLKQPPSADNVMDVSMNVV